MCCTIKVIDIQVMDNFLLSVDEYKYLREHKITLETRFAVLIIIPEVEKNGLPCVSGVLSASIYGGKQNINHLKNFLTAKMEEMKVGQGNQSVVPYNVPLITLSDSDSGNSISILVETQNTARKKRKKKYKKKKNSTEPKAKRIQMDMPLLPGKNFIPVNVEKGKITASTTNEADVSVSTSEDNIVVIEETIPRPIPENPRHLRPIVIDGSNVAIAHGECTNTYSSKGIQIAIDYFLKKGHTQVTAFVPLFRKSRNNGNFRTTGIKILKKLSKTQHVVFTPSWRRGNKLKMCYDDRFIVRLASITDGVVVSNDNYNDLIHVGEFRKTIKERLLKFCFVGDIFMVPDDPLGRHGPSLDDYLSFPATYEDSFKQL